MKHVLNPTTQTFQRTSRPTGTEYANAIENDRSNDHDGIAIVLICGVVLALAIVGSWIGGTW